MPRVDVERLELAEQMRVHLVAAHQAVSIPSFMNLGWDSLEAAASFLQPLRSPSRDYYLMTLGSNPRTDDLFRELLGVLDHAFNVLAAEVYTVPKGRQGALVDQLEAILFDAGEVAAAIVRYSNQSPQLRALLGALAAELRSTLAGGARISVGAKAAVRASHEHLVAIATAFNQAAMGGREFFDEALRLYAELPALLDRAAEEFRLMHEDEKKTSPRGNLTVQGNVGNLQYGDFNTINQTAGASLAEVSQILTTLRQTVVDLAPEPRQDALDCIDGIEEESRKESPSRARLLSYVDGVKKAAEAGGSTIDLIDKVVDLTVKLGPLIVALVSRAAGS